MLTVEMEEREQNAIQRHLKEAHLPKVKTLGEFHFSAAPHIAASKLKELAEGAYIERAEPVLFIGDSRTGKTHLLTARALRRPLASSMNSSRHSINMCSGAHSSAGRVMT